MDPRRVVHGAESGLRELRHERFLAFDAEGGVVCELNGGQSTVVVPPELWPLLNDRVCTHNHPGGWSYAASDPRRCGNSFSLEDLELACRAEVQEMRAVTPLFRHIVGPPPGGWNAAYYEGTLRPTYFRAERQTEDELLNRVRSGTMRGRTAEAVYYHEIMGRLSRELRLDYRRTR